MGKGHTSWGRLHVLGYDVAWGCLWMLGEVLGLMMALLTPVINKEGEDS